jgi:tetratricopeptide (TPR) repeat protein
MIIDNADDAQLFSGPGNLGKWIPECAHGSVLITTRNKVAGSRLTRGRCLIEVGTMDEGESRQLLQEKLDAENPNAHDLSALCSRLEYLPLALVQAAAFIQEMGISVNEYLRLLDKSDQQLVDLLNEEFETVGRDSETPHAVVETWILSFEQIQRQDTFAGELLSLMSVFDRQAIPKKFLSDYSERQEVQEPRGEMQLIKALGVLKAFSFITEDKDHGFDMHRLVQLVTRKWLGKKDTLHRFAEQALLVVSDNYPYGNHETRAICSAYLPHAYAVLKFEGKGLRDERLARASLLVCAGAFFYYQGQWKEAERFLIQATGVRKELLGEEYPGTLTSMGNLALTYSNQGRWKEAEELEVQVMEAWRRVLGEEHPHTLTSMGNLALTYWNQGRWKEAEELEVRAMETWRRVLGEEHPHTLTSMANLASTYSNQGRWKEAEGLKAQVMETRKRVLGEEHPHTLTSMANLAVTYSNQGRWKEAEGLGVQVMETRKRVLGEEHPGTLASMGSLAVIWESQGRHNEALDLMRQCVEFQQRILGPDHPRTVANRSILRGWEAASGRLHDETVGR